MCLPCFCFWHRCQKQIISHHVRFATQTYKHKSRERRTPNPLNSYQWIACVVLAIGLCADFSCMHSVTLHSAPRLCPLHRGPMHTAQCTNNVPGDRIKMHASVDSFASRFSLCLLSFFVLVINNQIVLGNWTTKRFLKVNWLQL